MKEEGRDGGEGERGRRKEEGRKRGGGEDQEEMVCIPPAMGVQILPCAISVRFVHFLCRVLFLPMPSCLKQNMTFHRVPAETPTG